MKTVYKVYKDQSEAEEFITLMRGQGYWVSVVQTDRTPIVSFTDADNDGAMTTANIADASLYWVVSAVK